MHIALIAVVGVVIAVAGVARAESYCNTAAAIAANTVGVPLPVLNAIVAVESGGKPWSLNIAGRSARFDDPAEAIRAGKAAVARGENVDVGCFQISTRHHGDQFAGIAEMISPLRSGIYAALYLRDLYKRSGSWADAVACYHSCNPAFGGPYLDAVAAALKQATKN